MKNTLPYKMLNYEVSPPEGIWKKIALELDESELTNKFPSRLYEAEVTPPENAWSKIAAQLDAGQVIAIPLQRRIFPFLKYAAAAVIIGFLTWGGIQLLNNNSGKNEVAIQENNLKEKESIVQSTKEIISTPDEKITLVDNTSLEDEARNDAALEASKKTYAKLDLPVKSRVKEIAAGYYFASSAGNENIKPANISNRYITLMTPEGNIIRMSKKFPGLVNCVYGEDEDKVCVDQLKKWREEIICLPSCHSTGGFMDMLTLVDALQDN